MKKLFTIALLIVSISASAQKKEKLTLGVIEKTEISPGVFSQKELNMFLTDQNRSLNDLTDDISMFKFEAACEPKSIAIPVSRLYMVEASVRQSEFAKRAKIKYEQEAKGYTFTGVKTINGKSYLTFGK